MPGLNHSAGKLFNVPDDCKLPTYEETLELDKKLTKEMLNDPLYVQDYKYTEIVLFYFKSFKD